MRSTKNITRQAGARGSPRSPADAPRWGCRGAGRPLPFPPATLGCAGGIGRLWPPATRTVSAWLGIALPPFWDYPTFYDRGLVDVKRILSGRKTIVTRSRVSPPEIFVRCTNDKASWKSTLARAHLRHRKG